MSHLYIYTFLASLIAVCGYMANNQTMLIGAMLISPLLTPIFTLNKDISGNLNLGNSLLKHNGKAISLILVCLITGYIATKVIKLNKETEMMQSTVEWEETYLKSRINYIIPLLAGIVLAYGKNDDDIASIIGVGITISVLPPLVNAGMLKGIGGKDKKAWISFKLAILNLIITGVAYTGTKYIIGF